VDDLDDLRRTAPPPGPRRRPWQAAPPPQSLRAPQSCRDGEKTGLESDIDCGGPCRPCPIEKSCRLARDCISGLCNAGECVERPYEPGTPIPPGYDLETSHSDAAASTRTAGMWFFAAGYAGAYVAALSLPSRLGAMYVPVLGPWIAMGELDTGGAKAALAIDGTVQGAGVVLFLGGLVGAGHQLVRSDVPVATLQVLPTVGRDQASIDLLGTF